MRLTPEEAAIRASQQDPALAIYRATTVAFLRKYFRMAVELGHLPSLLGREFFRTHVTAYGTSTFEDAVIFTHDVERCLDSLEPPLQAVIARVVFQEYTQAEAARLLGWSVRTLERRYGEAVDRLTHVFVERGLLQPIQIASPEDVLERLETWKCSQDETAEFPPKKRVTRAEIPLHREQLRTASE